MELHLTFVYRANNEEPHPLDAFGPALTSAMQVASSKAHDLFKQDGFNITNVNVSTTRIEAPVKNSNAIQQTLLDVQSELRGLLVVDSSVDHALKNLGDVSIAQRPRLNIYRDLIDLRGDDLKGIPAVLSLAKKEGYMSVCIVLKAIGDHTNLSPSSEDQKLANKYVSGDMADASPEHKQLCAIADRRLFSSDPDWAKEEMAKSIRMLSLLIQSAKLAGFSSSQIFTFPTYDEILRKQDKMLIIYDRHAHRARGDISADEVILPFDSGSAGFANEHGELLTGSLSLQDHARMVIKECLRYGKRIKWAATASE